MKQVTIGLKEVNIIENWDELTIQQYLEMRELNIEDDEYAYKILTLISDLKYEEILDMYEKDLEPLVGIFNGFKIDEFKPKEPTIFELNNIKYGYRKSSDMKIGEYISVKNLLKSMEDETLQSEKEQFKKILSVLIRPAKLIEDEFGTSWELQKEIGNFETLQKREEIVLQIKATEAIWIVDDFMYGRTR